MHIEKKYVCEHNNGFINKHKNKFYLKRGKGIEGFILRSATNGYSIPRLKRAFLRNFSGKYILPCHVIGIFAKFSARVTNIKCVFICSASLAALSEVLEFACVLMAGSEQRMRRAVGDWWATTSWCLGTQSGLICSGPTCDWHLRASLTPPEGYRLCHSVPPAWALHLVSLVSPLSYDEGSPQCDLMVAVPQGSHWSINWNTPILWEEVRAFLAVRASPPLS